MDQPEDSRGRRSRNDGDDLSDALSPTERLERLREGLNRRSLDRPTDRQSRAARPGALRDREADSESPSRDGADVLPFDPPMSDAPAGRGEASDRSDDDGVVIPAADVDAPPAPREKARWRSGTGPRASAQREAAERGRSSTAREQDPIDAAPPEAEIDARAKRGAARAAPPAVSETPADPPSSEAASIEETPLQKAREGIRRRIAATGSPKTRGDDPDASAAARDRTPSASEPSAEDDAAAPRRKAASSGRRKDPLGADRPSPSRARRARRGDGETSFDARRIDPEPPLTTREPVDEALQVDAPAPTSPKISPLDSLPELGARIASAASKTAAATEGVGSASDRADRDARLDDADAPLETEVRARQEPSPEPAPRSTPTADRAFERREPSFERTAAPGVDQRSVDAPLEGLRSEPEFDVEAALRDVKAKADVRAEDEGRVGAEPRRSGADWDLDWLEAGASDRERRGDRVRAPSDERESAPNRAEAHEPSRGRMLGDEVDALLAPERASAPSDRSVDEDVDEDLDAFDRSVEDDRADAPLAPSARRAAIDVDASLNAREDRVSPSSEIAPDLDQVDEPAAHAVSAFDESDAVDRRRRSDVAADLDAPRKDETVWSEEDAFWGDDDEPPVYSGAGDLSMDADAPQTRAADRQSDIRSSLGGAFARGVGGGDAALRAAPDDASDADYGALRQSDEAIAPLVPVDPLSRSDWEEAHKARERAFYEAAREVEQRRALRSSGSRPFSLQERMLAGRYLRARRKEGFISVIAALSLLGIALGVAILIIVMSVMNGFRAELVSKIVGVNGHLMVMSLSNEFTDFREISERVRAVPGVTRAAPLVEGQALASAPRNSQGVVVRGVSKEDLLTLEKVSVSPEFSMGSLSEFDGDRGVAIGQRLALKLGLNVGDNISLTSPRGATTPFGIVPRSKSYRILYVFKVGMSHYDEGVVFMPLFEAQKFFNKNGGVDAIEVMVATPERLTGYREDIEAAAGRPIFIGDWIESNRSLIGALKTERTVMFLILSFLILIASLIIISGMIMLVKEKGRDIAILRTMGMTRGAVMRVFFMCGASIGLVGTVVGVALGLVFCANIDHIADAVSYLANGDVFPEDVYILSQLPAQVHMEDVVMTVGIALGLSFLATLYPAWRAARLDPVEALRYE